MPRPVSQDLDNLDNLDNLDHPRPTSRVTLAQFLAATAVVACGSLVQGSVGFGLGVVGAPLLVLIEPRLVPGPLLCGAGALVILLMHREWNGIAFGHLRWSLPGYLVGVASAGVVLTILSADAVPLLFAGLVLLAVGLTAWRLGLRPSAPALFAAAILSGIMGTIASIGGPAIALVYHRESGPRVRGTLSAFFLVGIVLSLAGLTILDRFGREEILLALALLPGVILGYALSPAGARLLDRGYTRPAILIVSAAAAVAVAIERLV